MSANVCSINGFPYRPFPCNECPIRADNVDNPSSHFPAERWEVLSSSVESPGGFGPSFDSPMFGCHKGMPGRPDEDLACAGWLAIFGGGHPRVRLAVALEQLPLSALRRGANWPPLHPDWTAVVRNQTLVEGEGESP